MRKIVQNTHQLNGRNSFNSYKDTQKEKDVILYTIKNDFKNSIAHWQCKKKVDKLIHILQKKM